MFNLCSPYGKLRHELFLQLGESSTAGKIFQFVWVLLKVVQLDFICCQVVNQLVTFRSDAADVELMPCWRNKRSEDMLSIPTDLPVVQIQQALTFN